MLLFKSLPSVIHVSVIARKVNSLSWHKSTAERIFGAKDLELVVAKLIIFVFRSVHKMLEASSSSSSASSSVTVEMLLDWLFLLLDVSGDP